MASKFSNKSMEFLSEHPIELMVAFIVLMIIAVYAFGGDRYPPDGELGYYTTHREYTGNGSYTINHVWHPVPLNQVPAGVQR
jgi:hypothetical protein